MKTALTFCLCDSKKLKTVVLCITTARRGFPGKGQEMQQTMVNMQRLGHLSAELYTGHLYTLPYSWGVDRSLSILACIRCMKWFHYDILPMFIMYFLLSRDYCETKDFQCTYTWVMQNLCWMQKCNFPHFDP